MYRCRNRAQGWGQSPEPSFGFEDEYGSTHGVDQAIGSGAHWASNETLSDDSNLYIDPAILGNPGGNSSSDEYAGGEFEFEFDQDDFETNSNL